MPSGSTLKIIWKSRDDLRIVVSWIDNDYGKVNTVWTPAYILDLNFKKPQFHMKTYGGFADHAKVIDGSPWKWGCIRLD